MKRSVALGFDDDEERRWRTIKELCDRTRRSAPRDPLWQEAVDRAEMRLYDKLLRNVLPGIDQYAAAIELQRFVRVVVNGEFATLRRQRYEEAVDADGNRLPRPHPLNAGPLGESVGTDVNVELQALRGAALTEALAALGRAFERADDQLQQIVLMRDFAELSFREVAELTTTTGGAARKAYSRFHKRW